MDTTNITLFGGIFVSLVSLSVFIFSKRNALIPLFVITCYMTIGQNILVAGYNITPIRMIIFVYIIRIVVMRELKIFNFNELDKIFIIWGFIGLMLFSLRVQDYDEIKTNLGVLYNAFGLYIIFRSLINSYSDIEYILKFIPVIIFPLALLMIMEFITGKNEFAVFGGVPVYSWVRDGKVRCQGPFRHAILAGTFGATLVPFMWYRWKENIGKRVFSLIGVLSALIITITSFSSGPLMSLVFITIALSFWRIRERMKIVRWGIVIIIIGFHLIMKAPVWYLLARIGNILGGDGWHRAYLIEQSVKYINEWWMIGTSITSHWMPYTLAINGQADITNTFIAEGIHGGIIQLLLFIYIIVVCFKYIGLVIYNNNDEKKYLAWIMGATLVGHIAAFISVTYFDQIVVMYYLLISMISLSYDILKTNKCDVYEIQETAIQKCC